MKKPHLIFLAVVTASLAAFAAIPADKTSAEVALRFVAADDAFTAIKLQLGPTAAESVSAVDVRRNSIALDSDHPQAAKVREFLTTVDHRTPQVRVEATITRRIEATATSPARDEVLSRPTVLSPADKPVIFKIPDGSTQIELRITSIPN